MEVLSTNSSIAVPADTASALVSWVSAVIEDDLRSVCDVVEGWKSLGRVVLQN